MKNNNKGFSLVEMLVAVAILSIVMMGIVGILASMSKSFGASQREVALQDSVQSTYAIVSELIKEAQVKSETADALVFDADSNRAYIYVENTTDDSQSVFYIIEHKESAKNLYLYRGKLKKDDGTAIDPTGVSSSDVCQPKNLLAINVKTFDIAKADSVSQNGYVILCLECEYGTRKASMTQNVYLRNSNKSAEWHQGISSDSESELDGFVLKDIVSGVCNKSPFYVNTAANVDDFTIIGRWENADGVIKDAPVPADRIQCSDFGVPVTGTFHDYLMDIVDYDDEEGVDGVDTFVRVFLTNTSASGGTISLGQMNIDPPAMDTISQSGNIRTYYTTGFGYTLEEQDITETVYKCAHCGGKVNCTLSQDPWNAGFGKYLCENAEYVYNKGSHAGSDWGKINDDAGVIVSTEVVGQATVKVPNGQTTGQLTIINESTTQYNSVEVVVYFEQGDASFIPVSGGNYLTFDNLSTGGAALTYDVTAADGNGGVKFIKINIPVLNGYVVDDNGEKVTDAYTLNFKWECASGTPTMAVYSVKTD